MLKAELNEIKQKYNFTLATEEQQVGSEITCLKVYKITF